MSKTSNFCLSSFILLARVVLLSQIIGETTLICLLHGRDSRARETSEKHERGMMGTRVERERGPLPITPFVSAFLNN